MKISEIQIVPVKAQDGLIGFASCVIDNQIFLGSIAIFTKISDGLRLVYPTKKISNNSLHYHHPINAKASKEVEEAVCKVAKKFFYI